MNLLALLRISGQGLLLSRAYIALGKFERWSLYDLVMMLAGLAGFYFLSRRIEHTADAGAVGLCGNPEDMVTALLKVSRLNLMPIQWGKATGTWLTTPPRCTGCNGSQTRTEFLLSGCMKFLTGIPLKSELPAIMAWQASPIPFVPASIILSRR